MKPVLAFAGAECPKWTGEHQREKEMPLLAGENADCEWRTDLLYGRVFSTESRTHSEDALKGSSSLKKDNEGDFIKLRLISGISQQTVSILLPKLQSLTLVGWLVLF
jgi:hypothetical protein